MYNCMNREIFLMKRTCRDTTNISKIEISQCNEQN